MKKVFDKTFLLYVVLGFFNYFICSAVMLFFRNVLLMGENACLIISFVLQTVNSFVLNRFVTFRSKRISHFWPLKFIASIAVCYVISKVLLKQAYESILNLSALSALVEQIRSRVAQDADPAMFKSNLVLLACTFTYCVVNYVGQRYFVFKEVKQGTKDPEPPACKTDDELPPADGSAQEST